MYFLELSAFNKLDKYNEIYSTRAYLPKSFNYSKIFYHTVNISVGITKCKTN